MPEVMILQLGNYIRYIWRKWNSSCKCRMYYRCSHNHVPVSNGHLKDNIIICPMHGARFDIKTGKKVSDPIMPSLETDTLPSNL